MLGPVSSKWILGQGTGCMLARGMALVLVLMVVQLYGSRTHMHTSRVRGCSMWRLISRVRVTS